jgi:hypothetical protein
MNKAGNYQEILGTLIQSYEATECNVPLKIQFYTTICISSHRISVQLATSVPSEVELIDYCIIIMDVPETNYKRKSSAKNCKNTYIIIIT